MDDTLTLDRQAPERPPGEQGSAMPPAEWAGRFTSYPSDRGIAELFAEQVALRPEAVALVEGAAGGSGRHVTYRELGERSDALAERLVAAGVTRSAPVALAVERSVDMVVGMLGILQAGGGYVPLDADYPRDRLVWMLEDSGATVLVADARSRDRLPLPETLTVVSVDSSADRVAPRPSNEGEARDGGVRAGADDLAYVTYTSGSTGRPKGVAVAQRGVARLVRNTDYTELGPDETFLQIAATSFDATTFEVWGSLLNGGRLVLAPPGPPDLDALARLVARQRLTALWVTTGLFHRIVEDRPECMEPVRHVMTGGDVISPVRCRGAFEVCPHIRLTAFYGPTENTTFSTFDPMDGPESVDEPVPIGRPIANSTVYVVDGDLQPVPVGEVGELLVGGDGVAWGYWGRPGLSAERFVPDPFSRRARSGFGDRLYRTGDLVRWRPDGRLDFIGRNDQQVKIRGFRIEPGEIETALAEVPGVTEVLVLPREIAGSKSLVAYVVADGDAAERPDPLALRSYLDGRLPEYMHPAAFVPLERFPLTANGKVDRRALPEPTAEHRSGAARYVEPAEGLERDLAAVWAEVLELPRVGAEDEFLALGGHSLLATRIAARLRATLGLDVPFRALLEARTVRRLAARIEEEGEAWSAAGEVETVPRAARRRGPDGGVLPASAAQRRLWLVHEAEPDLCAYNIPFAYALDGPLDDAALEAALLDVVERHESLRTTFTAEDGTPVQVIRSTAWAAGAIHLERIDLSDLDADAAEAEVVRLRVAEERIPFDLEAGPLVRTRLLRLPPVAAGGVSRHVWLLTIHHLVFDGWSVSVLLGELGAAYRARVSGRDLLLPPPRLQYADFTAWEDARLQGTQLDRHLDHWRTALGEPPVPTRMPTDRPRQARRSFRGSTVATDLDAGAVERLTAVAKEHGATLFMALLAVWQLVLHRVARQDEVLVAAAVAGRQHREAEPLIGFFANYLLVRADLEDDPGFGELLERVRRATAEGMEHLVPFDLIVRTLQPERGSGGLDAVTFAMDTTRPPEPELAPGLALTPLEHRPETAKCELALLMDRRADRARLEYNADLFDRRTAQVWLDAFAAAVDGAASAPRRPVSEIMLVRSSGQTLPRPLAAGWHGGTERSPEDSGLDALFEAVAAERGSAIALTTEQGEMSYEALDRRANRLAHALVHLGVRRGDRVALALERSADLIVSMLGVIKAGAAYVPLDPRYPVERLTTMVEDGNVTAVVGEHALLERFDAAVGGLAALVLDGDAGRRALDTASDAPPALGLCGDDLAYVMFTSGSTGRPKGVAVAHRGIDRLVREADYARFGPEDVFLHQASVSFDASTFELWAPLLSGARLVVPPPGPLTVEEIGRAIADGGVDHLLLTTGLFHQVAEEAPEAFAPIRRLFTGGEVLSPAHARKVVERGTGMTLFNVYGPTENTCYTTVHALGGPGESAGSAAGTEVPEPVPIGRPIARTTVFVTDPALRPVPEMVPGELLTGGDGLAWGYCNRPALTAERFVPDPFADRPGGRAGGRLYRTGDLVRWLHDGTLDFLGRTDTQVKLRGFRIELGEVEAALAAHPAVGEVVVVASQVAGQRALVAYVVPTGEDAPSPGDLRRHAGERLAAFMVPSAFVTLERLPLTTNGKVDRRRLPAPSTSDRAAEAGFVEPATDAERRVATLWADVLDVERVGAEDDFFHLGGHSLLATKLVARLRAEDDVAIPMGKLFEAPTVRQFAEVLQAATGARDGAGNAVGDGVESASPIGRRKRRRYIRRTR